MSYVQLRIDDGSNGLVQWTKLHADKIPVVADLPATRRAHLHLTCGRSDAQWHECMLKTANTRNET